MRRFALLPLFAGLTLLVASCGGSANTSAGGGASAGASVAPASAPVFVSIDTDSGSGQWKKADELLSKFPAKQKLLDYIDRELAKQGVSYEADVKPALGPELDVVVLSLAKGSRDVVGMVQPSDKAKLQALLAKIAAQEPSSKLVTAEYQGWTLVSDKQAALDTFEAEAAKGALADDATFKEAIANEPSDSLARAYVNGAALQQLLADVGGTAGCSDTGSVKLRYIGGTLSAESDGVRLHGAIQSENAPSTSGGDTSALLSEIPSGALAVLAFHGTDQFTQGFQALQGCESATKSLQTIESFLGVKLEDLAALFANETALYVRPGSPIPEVTLISHQDDAQKALETVDTLAHRLGALFGSEPQDTTIDGAPAKELVVGGRISIFYAAVGSEIIVTDSRTGFADFRGSGPKLKDDPAFEDAQKASGMPDDSSAFLYVDLKDAVPLVEDLAQLAGAHVPPDVDANLQPLKSFVIYGSGTGGKSDFTAFLELQ